MRIVLILGIALWLAPAVGGVKTRAEPYTSDDRGTRLAKQRLLSMYAAKPGIRFRLGDQLTKLADMDKSIKTLESSVTRFQDALSQVAGVIDIPKAANGLVPQMQAAVKNVERLDRRLKSLHGQAMTQMSSLYNTAQKIPQTLTKNLQKSIDNLVTTYNQQIVNQVHSLERQRESTVQQSMMDARSLNRSVQAVQRDQLIDVRKLSKQIASDRIDLLSTTSTLNSKFLQAASIVNSALSGVKTKSSNDLALVEGIVTKNKQALVDYLTDAGQKWTVKLQSDVEKAAKTVSKALVDMSKSLSQQFADAKKKADADLLKVGASVDGAVSSVGRTLDAAQRKFDLAIKNATQVTDRVIEDLSAPIADIRDQVTAAQNLMSTTQQDVTVSVSAISANATRVATGLVSQFQSAAHSVAANPGFSNLTQMAANVYASAQQTAGAAQTSAQTRVAALEGQMGGNHNTLAEISAALTDSIAAQNRDFNAQTQAQVTGVQSQVDATSAQLAQMASENAALVDEAKAAADAQLASAADRAAAGIAGSHTAATAAVGAVSDRVNQTAAQAQNMISSAFGGVLAEGQNVLAGASGVAASAADTAARVANLSSAIALQNKQTSADLASASGQMQLLHQQGSNAVDQFAQFAGAATSQSVNAFATNANGVVDEFATNAQAQLDALKRAQQKLTETETGGAQEAAASDAALRSNLTRAKDMLNALKGNSTITDAAVRSRVNAMLADFKSGSLAEVSNLKAATAAQLQAIALDLKDRVAGAGGAVSNQTKGFVDALTHLSNYVAANGRDLDAAVAGTSGGVSDFGALTDKLAAEISSMSDGLKLYYQNTTAFVNNKLDDTEQLLNESRADAAGKIDEAWTKLHESMAAVDGSTAQKIQSFRSSVSESIKKSDAIVKNFTSYMDAMVAYEHKTAASRLAVQRGLLSSIMAHAADANKTSPAQSAEMIQRLKAVLGTASGAVGASNDELAAHKASQAALIDAFGMSTAAKVNDLLGKLEGNSAAFAADVGSSGALAAGDSAAMLRSTGLGVGGVVDLANGMADSVDSALNETSRRFRESQVAMAALSAETGGLSNITEAQLSAILQAMSSSQLMFSSSLDAAKQNNSDSIALISGVIRDFVTLVNETLEESNDLVSGVDANYTEASLALSSKMDTVLGFINRQASAVSESAESSGRLLKNLLSRNGAMEDGIRERLQQLSKQQDAFATNVHDQLQSYIGRINEDSAKLTSARSAATNKLYEALQTANADFAAKAAEWQRERLATPASFIQRTVKHLSDDQLLQDVFRHLDAVSV